MAQTVHLRDRTAAEWIELIEALDLPRAAKQKIGSIVWWDMSDWVDHPEVLHKKYVLNWNAKLCPTNKVVRKALRAIGYKDVNVRIKDIPYMNTLITPQGTPSKPSTETLACTIGIPDVDSEPDETEEPGI